MGRLKLW